MHAVATLAAASTPSLRRAQGHARSTSHRYTLRMDAPDARSRGAVLSDDTTAEAERMQVEIWRRMSSLERAQVITGACQAARAFAFAGLRQRHPEATDRTLVALYVELTAGPELARQAYPGLLEPAARRQP